MNDLLLLELAGVCLYRNILKDKCVQELVSLLRLIQDDHAGMEGIIAAWSGINAGLYRANAASFHDHIHNLIRQDENPFTLSCERREAERAGSLTRQAASELRVLEKLSAIRCGDLKKKLKEKVRDSLEVGRLIDALPDWNVQDTPPLEMDIEERIRWHGKNGAGLLSAHAFFIWDGTSLSPVINPDPVTLDKLYLLESQKEMAIKNTKQFLSGKTANNILFYGDRGTGKSSLVKALANEFSSEGLRLVEIPKKHLDQIPAITATLSGRGLKFILFIDDLTFENNEERFTALKAVLEGGLEYRPSNILLYATSNRRHLVKESFADRKGLSSDNPDEEIRARDGLQEKLSLADRFGITIVFSSPLKKEYLEIVRKMAEEENLQTDPALLELKAMQWEMSYNGMSPRTARQFINWMKAGGESG